MQNAAVRYLDTVIFEISYFELLITLLKYFRQLVPDAVYRLRPCKRKNRHRAGFLVDSTFMKLNRRLQVHLKDVKDS